MTSIRYSLAIFVLLAVLIAQGDSCNQVLEFDHMYIKTGEVNTLNLNDYFQGNDLSIGCSQNISPNKFVTNF